MIGFGIIAGVVVQYRTDMPGVVSDPGQPPDDSRSSIDPAINARVNQSGYTIIFTGAAIRVEFAQ